MSYLSVQGEQSSEDEIISLEALSNLPVSGPGEFLRKITATTFQNAVPSDISSVWGGITGTLSNQIDLQTIINLKANLGGGNTFTGSQTFDTNTLFIDSVNHKVGIGTTSPTASLHIENPSNVLLYGERTLDTFDSVQHIVAPSTWTNDTNIVKPGYYTNTGDVLNVISDFLYIGKDTTFTDIYFDIGTIMSDGTERRWEYNVPEYETAVVTGSVSATTMTVTVVTSGKLFIGDTVTDGATLNAVITAFGTGTGGTGTYTISPTSGTIASTEITARGTWKTLTITTDGTDSWNTDGAVNFTAPVDWTTATVNSVADLYWVRVGTESGSFSTEPTMRLVLPATSAPTSVAEIYSGDGAAPDFTINDKGNIGIGYLDPSTYKLRVNGPIYSSSVITGVGIAAGGSITGATSIAFTTTLTQTAATIGQNHAGGLVLNGLATTAAIPNENSPVVRFSSKAWNGYNTKTNAMDIYVNPDSESITKSRMAFKNTTVNDYADASELMNITSDGTLNVIGLAQPRDRVFDHITHNLAAVWTNDTALLSNFGNISGDVLNGTGDAIYFGNRDTFSQIQIVIGTAKSTGGTFAWEYWDGDSWETLTVTDGTINGTLGPLSQNGNVDITVPGDWAQTSVGLTTAQVGPLYYVRLRVTGSSFTTKPTLQLALPDTSVLLTGEIFSDTYFNLGTSNWDVTGDWAYTTNDYTFTYNTGSGTLFQLAEDFLNPAKPNTWYRFRYQVGTVGPATTMAWIGSEFAEGNTYFQVSSATEIDVFFKSNSNPGDFVIYTSATALSGLTLLGASLTELKDGNIANTGIYSGGGTSGLKIDYLGNVGIGTTSPVAMLSVRSTGTTDLLNLVETGGTEVFTVLESGNVGIGQTAPGAKLEVTSTGVGMAITYDHAGGNTLEFTAGGVGGDAKIMSSYYGDTPPAGMLIKSYSGGNQLYLKNNGNVGIGTTAPNRKLDISGADVGLRWTDTSGSGKSWMWAVGVAPGDGKFVLYDFAGGTHRMTIDTSGNVGIGTTSPATKLDIAGTMQVSSAVALSLGGYVRKYSEAVSAALSGATGVIAVNIPVGARLLGVQLRVDTLITSGDGSTAWSAAYTGGATQAIASGQAFTKNTKVNTMFDPFTATPLVVSSVATITISATAGTFSAGVVRAICYYEDFTAMGTAA